MSTDVAETLTSPPPVATVNAKPQFNAASSIKKVSIATVEQGQELVEDFDVITVDKPENWPAATDIKASELIEVPGTSAKKKFNLSGISYRDWEIVERRYPIPEQPTAEDGKKIDAATAKDFEDRKLMAILSRKAELIEVATGIKIPGSSIIEKVEWIKERPLNEISALYEAIEKKMAGFGDSMLLIRYEQCLRNSVKAEVKEVTSFEDWDIASATTNIFRIAHQGSDYILEIPLKAIGQKEKNQIEEECKRPEPPRIFLRDPQTKRLNPNMSEPNYKDPAWLENVRVIEQKRTVMLLERSLMFEIPGSNLQQKFNWLAERIVNDIIQLENFIQNEVAGYRQRLNFF